MQLFLADCQFPDIENQVKAYQLFVEAWENGEIAKSDKTDKFEMLFRVHAPGEGRVVCLCKAESDKEKNNGNELLSLKFTDNLHKKEIEKFLKYLSPHIL